MDYSDYLVNRQIQESSRAFKKGMIKLIDSSSLKLFNHDELNRIISGSRRSIDVADLKKHMLYNGYKP
jgi:ubiquitin-protein ligase E3 C